ncbi:SDR family oxidoreductase [Paracoccus liaowanqingii]|uniref:SDR family oxidoreductase n=1 Tax=Paracoccus liaowanqingii TaxID=2560053 RepID=UPI001E2A3050|nr:SDR family oxidoreductase [Paracoccus liaowanqingii]
MTVTGTGGIGYQTALALARAGAEVILAGRDPAKGRASVDSIRSAVPGATLRFEVLDLASLASVAAFGDRIRFDHHRLDLLVNNAGVMTPPTRRSTADGFELRLGTNYLGHFALTAHLLPLLQQGTNARVIALSSVAARSGQIDFDDLQAERSYRPMPVYAQSKLACLMFAIELQRRSTTNNWGIASIAAHPGVSRTDLLPNSAGRWDIGRLVRVTLPFLFQPASQGALPVLFAATSPDAESGGYYGPDRMGETRGHPMPARVPPQALDPETASRLWDWSEQLTGVSFPEAAPQ